jgi:hypothetical protein
MAWTIVSSAGRLLLGVNEKAGSGAGHLLEFGQVGLKTCKGQRAVRRLTRSSPV